MSHARKRLRELFVAALAKDARERFGLDLAALKRGEPEAVAIFEALKKAPAKR